LARKGTNFPPKPKSRSDLVIVSESQPAFSIDEREKLESLQSAVAQSLLFVPEGEMLGPIYLRNSHNPASVKPITPRETPRGKFGFSEHLHANE
jgi:hypothetical protein